MVLFADILHAVNLAHHLTDIERFINKLKPNYEGVENLDQGTS